MRFADNFMRNLLAQLLLICALCCASSSSLRAESRYRADFKSCRDYGSATEFVRRTSLYCLKQPNSTACEREARVVFEQCGFDRESSYSKISRLIYEKLFLAVVTAKLIDVNRLEK
ncbi:MAG: hypothetical protein K1X83_05645 [Oligoflexia bacterium]|nr:hypothetical protein [Oligoflexia bacterium]